MSEVTIRNDLEHLERKNLLVRARGGAIHTENHVGIDQRIAEKNKLHADEKAAIGKLASSLINDGDTIIIDSGTTTAEIVKHLDRVKHLNVITNALNIANLLMAHPGSKCYNSRWLFKAKCNEFGWSAGRKKPAQFFC